MRDYPALLEPLLFYVLHRVTAEIMHAGERGTLEALSDGRGLALHPAPEATRVRGGGSQDLAQEERRHGAGDAGRRRPGVAPTLLRTVVESCPTTLFLANPALDRQQYADLFRLNAVQLEQLAALTPRRQLLLKRDQMSKVLTLDVDEASYWLYTNTPIDHARPERGRAASHRTSELGTRAALV